MHEPCRTGGKFVQTRAGMMYTYHHEGKALIDAPESDVFAWLDDHRNLASHMSRSSPMMAGGSMDLSLDELEGRQLGSHIRMQGRVLGWPLEIDEVVCEREPPRRKVWETVREPRLWVIGRYRMGFDLAHQATGCSVSVFIDYDLPASSMLYWLARWMSRPYAAWCVGQMLAAVRDHFAQVQSSAGEA